MSNLVALDLDASTLELLQTNAPKWSVALHVDPSDLESGDVALLLVGTRGSNAIRTAERAHVRAPEVPILIVASEDECRDIEELLRYNALLGSAARCVSKRPAELLSKEVRGAIEHARRRARHRETIASLNRRIDGFATGGRSAAFILDRLLNVAPIGVVVTDEKGHAQAVNPRAERLLACSRRRRILGEPIWTFFAAPQRERVQTWLRRLDDANGSPVLGPIPREDLQLEMTGARVGGEGGGFLLLVSDVTERFELIRQLEEANRRKDEFLAILGHELRNPLAPIRTALELMRLRDDASFERERAIIDRQVTHMTDLVDDLLDISRITRGRLELRKDVVEVASFVAEAVETTAPLLEAQRHELSVGVPHRGLRVFGDKRRLAQVIANLLSNAAKYTPPEGRIQVKAHRENDRVVVAVRDTGPGIEPDLLPHVFDLFVQQSQPLDRARGGLGIGLSIVRNLVEQHGGTVTVSSEIGEGTEFVVRLPAIETDVARPRRAARPRPERPVSAAATLRVLIIDDNVDAAEMLSELLRSLGHTTAVAHDGPSALSLAPEFGPDVALVDIGLPVMDGYELARRLRTLPGLEDLPLIAATGYGAERDRERSRDAGFSGHLVKPIELHALQEAIERVATAG